MRAIKYRHFQIESQRGYFISDGEVHALYFPLTSIVMQISERAFSCITDGEDLNDLICAISPYLAGAKAVAPVTQPLTESNVVGLALTNSCNLKCTYCHADSHAPNHELHKKLAPSIVERSIQRAVDCCSADGRDLYLVLIGSGEPTVSWKSLTYSIEYAKKMCGERGIKLHSIMSTNGVFGSVKRRYIVDNLSRISLSIDGPSHIHNRNRPLLSGGDSFKTAIATADFFYHMQFPFGIRTTIDRLSVQNILAIYEYFQSRFPGVRIAFEPLMPIGRGLENSNLCPNLDEFAEGYCSIIAKHGCHYASYSGASIKNVRTQFCGPVSSAHFNVEMSGKIRSCSRVGSDESFVYGQYSRELNSFQIDCDRRNEVSMTSVDNFEQCGECFARYSCAGDCPDLRIRGYLRCNANKRILWEYLKWKLSKEISQ